MKTYVLFAGVNGAGKSTLYSTLSGEILSMPRVNTDEIVRSLGDWRDMSVVLQAGKIAVKQLNNYFSQGVSFNQETTLCGGSVLRNIAKAKELGYKVVVHYIGVESVDIAKARVRSRVECGGHGVPDADIERRYVESINNLFKIIPVCDEVFVYDNTFAFNIFAKYSRGALEWINSQFPNWFNRN